MTFGGVCVIFFSIEIRWEMLLDDNVKTCFLGFKKITDTFFLFNVCTGTCSSGQNPSPVLFFLTTLCLFARKLVFFNLTDSAPL